MQCGCDANPSGKKVWQVSVILLKGAVIHSPFLLYLNHVYILHWSLCSAKPTSTSVLSYNIICWIFLSGSFPPKLLLFLLLHPSVASEHILAYAFGGCLHSSGEQLKVGESKVCGCVWLTSFLSLGLFKKGKVSGLRHKTVSWAVSWLKSARRMSSTSPFYIETSIYCKQGKTWILSISVEASCVSAAAQMSECSLPRGSSQQRAVHGLPWGSGNITPWMRMWRQRLDFRACTPSFSPERKQSIKLYVSHGLTEIFIAYLSYRTVFQLSDSCFYAWVF